MTEQDAAFERCVDFLVRMMNKYGKEFAENYGGGGHEFAAACTLKKDNRSEILNRFII